MDFMSNMFAITRLQIVFSTNLKNGFNLPN